jgi:hypothetical protein
MRGVGPDGPHPDDVEAWHEHSQQITPLGRDKKHRSDLVNPGKIVPKHHSACPVLDLHGMTEVEAFHALCEAVATNVEMGLKRMVVITGMGRSRPGGGVLRRELPRWLEVMPQVARFSVYGAECRLVLRPGGKA